MGARIKALRVQKYGLRGKAAFARDVGVTGNAVDFWEKGGTPKGDVLQKIADVFGVSVRFLLSGAKEPEEMIREARKRGPESEKKRKRRVAELRAVLADLIPELKDRKGEPEDLSRDFVVLPLLDNPVAAGEPRELWEKEAEGVCVVHKNWAPHPDASVFIRVKGDSMSPGIPDGSFVCIDTTITLAEQALGKVVLISTGDGEATLKRLERTERGEFIGCPDHLTAENRPIYIKEGDRIVGLVRSVHAEVR